METAFSQTSTVLSNSTIPTEISYNQDELFIEELNQVDELYFRDRSSEDFNQIEEISCIEDTDSDHDESDLDSDSFSDDLNFQTLHVDDTDVRDCDRKETEARKSFRDKTCGCKDFYGGEPCSTRISWDDLAEFRESCAEFTKDELDVAIKFELLSHRRTSNYTLAKKHKQSERERPYQEYYFAGQRVCRKTFCFAHGIHRHKLQAISKSLDRDGLKARVHGNTGKIPKHGLTVSDRQIIITFITSYAKRNALPLPGRLPSYRDHRVLLLPSDVTCSDLHEQYQVLASAESLRSISLRTFQRIWHEHCPFIVVTKPSTDLCKQCQEFALKISKSGNLSEEEKQNVLLQYSSHVNHAKEERNKYRDQCMKSKEAYSTLTLNGKEPGQPACSQDTTQHYSWDFAQQVHYPHHAQQVGPIFFKTPRKCAVFGMCAEGSGRQVFYLIDESQTTGKGANEVVSMAHHFFKYHSYGETDVEIHFDNCAGQKKNNTVLWYGLWRTLTGLHNSLQYSMMIAGHTKFDPDWHFGIWKLKWRVSTAETLSDVAMTVTKSSKSGHNVPQLLADQDKPVVFYDWRKYLQTFFKTLPNISKFQHFIMCKSEPGVVKCVRDQETVTVNLLKCVHTLPVPGFLPSVLSAPGLSPERQWYLYDHVQEYCSLSEAKDLTCPLPTISRPAKKSSVPCKRK